MTQSSLFDLEKFLYITLAMFVLAIPWQRTSDASEPGGVGKTPASRSQILSIKLVDPNTSVAIAGAWERVEASLANDLANKPWQARYRVPKQVGQRFMGFLEGLLRVSLPHSFSRNVTHADVSWNGCIRFPTERFLGPDITKNRFAKLPFEIPTIRSRVENGRVIVSVATGNFPSAGEDGNVTLPEALSKSIIENSQDEDVQTHISSALFWQGRVFVAVSNTDDPGGNIYCISNGKVVWSKKFTAYAGDSYYGNGDWFTEMRITDKELILFHCCERSFGIEGLSFDGGSLFEFSSLPAASTPSSGKQR